jgi:ElaB/YqjD/DUF883 family membrane-anchored ribosome-binding protein
MARSVNVEKEIAALKREISALKADYSKANGRAAKVAVEHFGTFREGVADTLEDIREKIAGNAAGVTEDIGEQLDELKSMLDGYTAETEKTIAAHPFATLAGAIAIGFLIGKFSR